jgi:hypothetical protein
LVRYAVGLTEREKEILRLSTFGLTDYRISRKIRADPGTTLRSHRVALRKIAQAEADLEYVREIGIKPQLEKKPKSLLARLRR